MVSLESLSFLYGWSGDNPKILLHITRSVKNTDDLEGLGFMPINDQVRIDEQEPMPLILIGLRLLTLRLDDELELTIGESQSLTC